MADNTLHRAHILKATLPDVRPFVDVLRYIYFPEQPRATMVASRTGLKFTVWHKKAVFATGCMYAHMFVDYTFQTPAETGNSKMDMPITIGEVHLGKLLTALDIFGHAGLSASVPSPAPSPAWYEDDDEAEDADLHATGMELGWMGTGHPLELRLEGDTPNAFSDCQLTVFQCGPMPDVPFDSDRIAGQLIMYSHHITPLFRGMSSIGDEFVVTLAPRVIISPSTAESAAPLYPVLRLEAISKEGIRFETDYADAHDIFQLVHVESAYPVQFAYDYEHVWQILPALHASVTTTISVELGGMLRLQFSLPVVSGSASDGDQRTLNANCVEFKFNAITREKH